jgi:hypothetical protein
MTPTKDNKTRAREWLVKNQRRFMTLEDGIGALAELFAELQAAEKRGDEQFARCGRMAATAHAITARIDEALGYDPERRQAETGGGGARSAVTLLLKKYEEAKAEVAKLRTEQEAIFDLLGKPQPESPFDLKVQLLRLVKAVVAVALKRPHDGSQLDEDLEGLLIDARKLEAKP